MLSLWIQVTLVWFKHSRPQRSHFQMFSLSDLSDQDRLLKNQSRQLLPEYNLDLKDTLK